MTDARIHLIWFFFAALCVVMGAMIGKSMATHDIRSGAIERGYAQYCPTNGKWAWKGECDE